MVRFATDKDSGFVSLVGELRRWLGEIESPAGTIQVWKGDISKRGRDAALSQERLVVGGITVWGDVKSSMVSEKISIQGSITFD